MKRTLIVFVLALALAAPAAANVCAHDVAPAASLLFPFVAYDYNSFDSSLKPQAGENSILTITNLSHEAQIVRVTLWSDLSMPVLNFNVLFTGYDTVRLDMREILVHGRLPVTRNQAHTGWQGAYDVGPVSSYNELNGDWTESVLAQPQATTWLGPRCATYNPEYPGNYATPIPRTALGFMRLWLTVSQRSPLVVTDDCEPPFSDGYLWQSDPEPWFQTRGASSTTWMYLTADVVEYCDRGSPADPGYWMAENMHLDNVLTGDVIWTDEHNTTAMKAVHLEADADLAQVAAEGNPGFPISFYARYSNPQDGVSDFREPLPTAWSTRFIGAEDPSTDTTLLVWKGSTRYRTPMDLEVLGDGLDPDMLASNCNAYTYYTWDEDAVVPHNTTSDSPPPSSADCHWVGPFPIGGTTCANFLPLAVQELSVSQLMTEDDRGWMLFVWPASNYDGLYSADPIPDFYQTWMGIRQRHANGSETFQPATVMANYNCFSDQVLPQLGINYDYVPEPAPDP